MTLTLDLPATALRHAVAGDVVEARKELIEQVAVNLYASGELPIGKAMALAGLTRAALEKLLKQCGARRPFDQVELDRDLAWAKT